MSARAKARQLQCWMAYRFYVDNRMSQMPAAKDHVRRKDVFNFGELVEIKPNLYKVKWVVRPLETRQGRVQEKALERNKPGEFPGGSVTLE
jgi:hypothetical protein